MSNNNLVLKFRQGERAMVSLPNGEVISIKLTHGESNIRVVFNAPSDVVIDRESVFDAKVAAYKEKPKRHNTTMGNDWQNSSGSPY